MKIGITGGTGFIGQSFINEYGDDFDIVSVTSRNIFEGLSDKSNYIKCNYTRDDFLRAFDGCDAVINLGSNVQQGSENLDAIRPYINNMILAEDIFSSCRELGISNIVNASSVAVYRQDEGHPLVENDVCEPNSTYGISKVAIEELANIYNKMYDMKIKSLRFSQVLGFNKKLTGFYRMLLENAIDDKSITIFGKGIAGRDVLYVKDAAFAIYKAVLCKDNLGPYNIGRGCISSNNDLAVAFREGFHNSSEIQYINKLNEDKHRWCIDISKAKEEIGFEPRFDLLDMTSDMYKEYSNEK